MDALFSANFDQEAPSLTLTFEDTAIYIYVYMERNLAIHIFIYIYMYMKVAPSLVRIGVRFIFLKRIRPERTQVIQDELVNHG